MRLTFVLTVVAAIGLSACGLDLSNPPRLATAATTGEAAASTPTPLVLPAPTTTGEAISLPVAEAESRAQLSIWVNEDSAAHRVVLDELAAEFSASYGVDVAVQLVAPARLPELVSTAVLSGTLPDLILHPMEYTAGWVQDGALDPGAAAEVIDRLGRDTFDPAALELLSVNGQTAAIPSDGYHQLLLYRADWFAEKSLRPPDTYAAMATAAESIFDSEAIISGLVIPTESNLVTTHLAFEQMALANGCRLIDEAGEVIILDPACATALDHYYTTIHLFSPPGVQTDTSARNALLAGRTGMIVTSPAILPDLAGLNPAAMPSCPECEDEGGVNYLARNVGVLTEMRGSAATAAPPALAGGQPGAQGSHALGHGRRAAQVHRCLGHTATGRQRSELDRHLWRGDGRPAARRHCHCPALGNPRGTWSVDGPTLRGVHDFHRPAGDVERLLPTDSDAGRSLPAHNRPHSELRVPQRFA